MSHLECTQFAGAFVGLLKVIPFPIELFQILVTLLQQLLAAALHIGAVVDAAAIDLL